MMRNAAPAFLRKLAKGAVELFAPPRCRVCAAPLWGHDNPFLCTACAGKMLWIHDGNGAAALPARPAADSLDTVAAVVRYSGGGMNLVRALKFHSERQLAAPMAALMAERWLRTAGSADLVLPVPLHPGRRRERGFDQSALLAEEIARRLDVPAAPAALRRTKATAPQALLRRAQRLAAMRNAFEADQTLVEGKTVLLVDDVFTTGATMSAAAAACKKAGAQSVHGLAFAR